MMSQRTKKHPVLTTCPVCRHELEVVKLHCDHCDTEIAGTFSLSKFNYLEPEKLYFIEIFVKNRGNIKAIEKELNISYPTVKKMLDEVVVGLGYSLDNDEEDEVKESKKDLKAQIKQTVLDQIEKGQISVEEALKALGKK